MTTQHTPGPWHRGTLFGQELYVFSPSGTAIIQAVNHRDVPLIAAAPDLLEALQGLVDLSHQAGFPCDKAEAAIAKATREQL